MPPDYAEDNQQRRKAEYKDRHVATLAAKKARSAQQRETKEADKERKKVALAEKRIKTREANEALGAELKRAKQEERKAAMAGLEWELKQAGLVGTLEARLRKTVLAAQFSRNPQVQWKGKFAQMSLDNRRHEADASEARERAARGECSAGVRLT
jgi:hypothetical protein